MAHNILGSESLVVTRTAPVGGVTSGVPFILGSECLIPLNTALVGVSVACVVKCDAVSLPFKSGDTWATGGLKVYFNGTSGECEAADSADNYLIGTYNVAVDATHISVNFDGTKLPAGGEDLDQKADKAAPASAHSVAGLTASGNLEDTTVLTANLATMAANGTAGNLVYTAGANKALSDASIVAANVVTTTGVATSAECVIVSAAGYKTIKPSVTLVSNLHRAVSIALTSVPNGTIDLAYTLPANSIVTGCSLYVDASAAAGVTLDVGIHGDDDCYLVNVPCDAAPGESYSATEAILDGTNNWYAGTYGGDALVTCVAGTNADDRGLFTTYFDNVVGTPAIAINGSAADAAFRGSIVLTYFQR